MVVRRSAWRGLAVGAACGAGYGVAVVVAAVAALGASDLSVLSLLASLWAVGYFGCIAALVGGAIGAVAGLVLGFAIGVAATTTRYALDAFVFAAYAAISSAFVVGVPLALKFGSDGQVVVNLFLLGIVLVTAVAAYQHANVVLTRHRAHSALRAYAAASHAW